MEEQRWPALVANHGARLLLILGISRSLVSPSLLRRVLASIAANEEGFCAQRRRWCCGPSAWATVSRGGREDAAPSAEARDALTAFDRRNWPWQDEMTRTIYALADDCRSHAHTRNARGSKHCSSLTIARGSA
ncbi:unnamed protein product [Lampetra planeri]